MFTVLLGYTLHQDFLFYVLAPQFTIDEQILLTATHQAFVFCPICVTATICQVLDERYSLVRLLSGRRWFDGVERGLSHANREVVSLCYFEAVILACVSYVHVALES